MVQDVLKGLSMVLGSDENAALWKKSVSLIIRQDYYQVEISIVLNERPSTR